MWKNEVSITTLKDDFFLEKREESKNNNITNKPHTHTHAHIHTHSGTGYQEAGDLTVTLHRF